RAMMRRQPPHILVTTPESLYLLLTSASGREMLSTVRTVIVDEIHAVAQTKRGAHLALTLERLAANAVGPVQRIGLSATQKPIEEVAEFLVGNGDIHRFPAKGDRPQLDLLPPEPAQARPTQCCTIVNTGHVRERDLALVMPPAPLES